jgi:predicted nuclease of predicted toxin-antitoxin system
MKFLADENFPRLAIQVLRDAGFEVAWSGDEHAGASDRDVLRLCATEHRTLLTFDKDFGELAFKSALPASCGILLFRITPQDPVEIAPLVLAAIRMRPDWVGFFGVVTRRNIRIRALPPGQSDRSALSRRYGKTIPPESA